MNDQRAREVQERCAIRQTEIYSAVAYRCSHNHQVSSTLLRCLTLAQLRAFETAGWMVLVVYSGPLSLVILPRKGGMIHSALVGVLVP